MYAFGDGFDLYNNNRLDIGGCGYWDVYNDGFGPPGLVAGRFTGGRALDMSATNCNLTKASGSNDAVHHITLAVQLTGAISGAALGTPYITLRDGTTNQCSIVFRTDGAILLTSGAYNGTVLDTYLGAITVQNQWYAFEIEVVVNSTTGSWAIKKNGNIGIADHTLGSLNTRGGTSNNYANSLVMGFAGGSFQIDDFLWRSDPSSVPWVGDIRCYTRMPASDVQKQFTPNTTALVQNTGGVYSSYTSSSPSYTIIYPSATGTIGSLTLNMNSAYTGNIKVAIFANNNGNPGTVISSTAIITNPAAGVTPTVTFTTPAPIVRGNSYFVGILGDANPSFVSSNTPGSLYNNATLPTYANFPQANPPIYSSTTSVPQVSYTVTVPNNYSLVADPQEDGLVTYVYDLTVGHADFYSVASIGVTPANTVAVTTRQFAQKGDAGSRSGAVQLKSGSTTVQSTPGALSTTWAWNWRTDLTDPATSAAWTTAGVNNAQIGPILTA